MVFLLYSFHQCLIFKHSLRFSTEFSWTLFEPIFVCLNKSFIVLFFYCLNELHHLIWFFFFNEFIGKVLFLRSSSDIYALGEAMLLKRKLVGKRSGNKEIYLFKDKKSRSINYGQQAVQFQKQARISAMKMIEGKYDLIAKRKVYFQSIFIFDFYWLCCRFRQLFIVFL